MHNDFYSAVFIFHEKLLVFHDFLFNVQKFQHEVVYFSWSLVSSIHLVGKFDYSCFFVFKIKLPDNCEKLKYTRTI